ncbi:zinc-ribbon domain containing protein [Lentibacillus salicampi]|nr:zinc-ribbon domain containing protein [Lentibacillus salicampi]
MGHGVRPRVWEIERDQLTDEFLNEWDQWLAAGNESPDMHYLKDRNRGMILLLLDKIQETGSNKYIPYLRAWEKIDYKKVRARIREVIRDIESDVSVDQQAAADRADSINEAMKGLEPHDIDLRCIECGNYFTFSVGEQRFYQRMGFVHPRRCPSCREQRDLEFL